MHRKVGLAGFPKVSPFRGHRVACWLLTINVIPQIKFTLRLINTDGSRWPAAHIRQHDQSVLGFLPRGVAAGRGSRPAELRNEFTAARILQIAEHLHFKSNNVSISKREWIEGGAGPGARPSPYSLKAYRNKRLPKSP